MIFVWVADRQDLKGVIPFFVLRGTRNAYLHQSCSVVLGVGRCCVVENSSVGKISSLHFTIYLQFEKALGGRGSIRLDQVGRQVGSEITRGAALDLNSVHDDFDTILKG